MKYFYDTEFIEYPNTIELISIGIKCEDGRKYHVISSEYNFDNASDWVIENVIEPIYLENVTGDRRNNIDISEFHKYFGKSIKDIKKEILKFVDFPNYKNGTPELYGYYSAYDHVALCWIFGKMIDLPEGFPMYTIDLKQEMDRVNAPKFKKPKGEHNALVDAEWNERLYRHIQKYGGFK